VHIINVLTKHRRAINFIVIACLLQGNLESPQEAQVNPTSLSQYRDIQRKIVEFIRKRYHILEKCLDIEYAVV
jgi:chromodomain-helicase-DNA-binding protein 4